MYDRKAEEYLRRQAALGYEPSLAGMDEADLDYVPSWASQNRTDEEPGFARIRPGVDRGFAEWMLRMFRKPADLRWQMPDMDGPEFYRKEKLGVGLDRRMRPVMPKPEICAGQEREIDLRPEGQQNFNQHVDDSAEGSYPRSGTGGGEAISWPQRTWSPINDGQRMVESVPFILGQTEKLADLIKMARQGAGGDELARSMKYVANEATANNVETDKRFNDEYDSYVARMQIKGKVPADRDAMRQFFNKHGSLGPQRLGAGVVLDISGKLTTLVEGLKAVGIDAGVEELERVRSSLEEQAKRDPNWETNKLLYEGMKTAINLGRKWQKALDSVIKKDPGKNVFGDVLWDLVAKNIGL